MGFLRGPGIHEIVKRLSGGRLLQGGDRSGSPPSPPGGHWARRVVNLAVVGFIRRALRSSDIMPIAIETSCVWVSHEIVMQPTWAGRGKAMRACSVVLAALTRPAQVKGSQGLQSPRRAFLSRHCNRVGGGISDYHPPMLGQEALRIRCARDDLAVVHYIRKKPERDQARLLAWCIHWARRTKIPTY